MTGDDIRAAYVAACGDELRALKPGNVHVHAAGHGMTAADFETAAAASAVAIADPGLALGECIYRAVEASRLAVPVNTNLGIVLLCAPLAQAAARAGQDADAETLRAALTAVLNATTRADAERCFKAIALADPGGLGEVPDQDVRQPPDMALRDAMALAADRDLIARQYVTGFADVFGIGLPRLLDGLARWHRLDRAVTHVHLGFLARFADSHVVRKFGAAAAAAVRAQAEVLDRQHGASAGPEDRSGDLMAFDAALKSRGINPGTSADLTVASLFLWRLSHSAAG